MQRMRLLKQIHKPIEWIPRIFYQIWARNKRTKTLHNKQEIKMPPQFSDWIHHQFRVVWIECKLTERFSSQSTRMLNCQKRRKSLNSTQTTLYRFFLYCPNRSTNLNWAHARSGIFIYTDFSFINNLLILRTLYRNLMF